jgi:hypothetical protein
MVMTVASNQFQSHNQLLRHGMLNWVTRGVFLGYQRNYLELQVDDLFLGDDAWNPATQRHRLRPGDRDPHDARRRRAGRRLVEVATGLRPRHRVTTAAQRRRQVARRPARGGVRRPPTRRNSSAGSTTPRAPEPGLLDVGRSSPRRSPDNVAWALQAHGLAVASIRRELVTGEHSGLANSRPGNPGTIDPPPFFDTLTPATTGGTLAAGTYDYAITAPRRPAGETTASVTRSIGTGDHDTSSVTATFGPRSATRSSSTSTAAAAGANSWSLVGSATRGAGRPRPTTARARSS